MGLLSQLKSLLGLGSETERSSNDVEVTVERESDATSERAVKDPADEIDAESGDESGVDDEETEAYEEEIESEGTAAGTDAAASTETLVEEDNADEPEAAAEPAEAAGPTDGDDDLEPEPDEEASEEDADSDGVAEETDAAASTETLVDEGSADGPETAAEPAEAAGPASGDGEPVERLKGIGPAYAETLGEAGVGSISDLAAVEDTETLAEETGLSAKRLGRWVERARSWEP